MAQQVVFKYGTRAQYDALQEKADNALYFLTDSGEILRGNVNLAKGSHYEGIYDPEVDTSDNDVIARVMKGKLAVREDIFIVKRLIANDKYSYTSYVYDNDVWQAMDGNYNANNVYLDNDITVTTTVGTITELTNGSATFAVKGLSIQKALEKLLAEEKEPKIVDPTYELTASATTTTKEIGGYVTEIKWDGTWNAGSYQYGSKENTATDTGITATYAMSNNKTDATATSLDGTFALADNIQIDTVGPKNYATITGKCTYIASPYTPVTNLGSNAAAGAIANGEISKTANVSVTGYRNSFYGVYNAKEVDGVQTGSTSDSIRLLTPSGKTLANGATFNISIPADAQRVVIAYPATLKDLEYVKDSNDSDANIVSAFTQEDGTAKATVSVAGANGYGAVNYKVFSTDFAGAYGTTNIFKVKIKA